MGGECTGATLGVGAGGGILIGGVPQVEDVGSKEGEGVGSRVKGT